MAEGFANGYALIIGVGGNLPETINDAIQLYKTLINPLRAGYPSSNVQLLIEESPKETLKKDGLTFSMPDKKGILRQR